MKNSRISALFFIAILFSSCFPSDIRFIQAQPEHLEELSFIPNQFQGIFVMNKDTVFVTDCTINGDTINSNTLVVKGLGNYLFVNSLENGVYKLGCAKVVNAWNNEDISLEYFIFSDTTCEYFGSLRNHLGILTTLGFDVRKVSNLFVDTSADT